MFVRSLGGRGEGREGRGGEEGRGPPPGPIHQQTCENNELKKETHLPGTGVTHICLYILSCSIIIRAVHSLVEFIHTTTNLDDISVICNYLTVHYFGNVNDRILALGTQVDS